MTNIKALKEKLNKRKNLESVLKETLLLAEKALFRFHGTNLMFQMVYYLADYSDIPESFFEDSVLRETVITFLEGVKQPEEVFLLKDEAREMAELQRMIRLKEELRGRVRILAAYKDQLVILEYIFDRLQGKFENNYKELESDEAFAGFVLDFIFQEENNVIINDKIKLIYGQLPIRMSKSRFYNYTDAAMDQIKGVSRNRLDEYIKTLKEVFHPESVEGFKEYFPELVTVLNQLMTIDYTQLNADSFKDFYNSLTALSDLHIQILEFYLDTVEMINRNLGMLHLKKAALLNEDPGFFSFLTEALISIHSLDEDRFEHILKDSEGLMEETLTDIQDMEPLISSLVYDFADAIHQYGLSDRLHGVQESLLLMNPSYFQDDEELFNDMPVDASFMAKKKRELTDYMDDVFTRDHRLVQRGRMASMLHQMNVVHSSPQEIYAYILEAFKSCGDSVEKDTSKRIMREIIMMYEEMG